MSKSIFGSLRKVDKTIVQTQWMKEALINKGGVAAERIVVQQPDISSNCIGQYVEIFESRRRLFYPATAFMYKNHMTLLKALKYAQDRGFNDYELILTIRQDENKYTQDLFSYSNSNNLNVIFGGPIPREQVFEMYTKSVLVFPSYVESFGLPLLEAKMTGCPIIAAYTSFSREILNGYEFASFFEDMDANRCGELIISVCKNTR